MITENQGKCVAPEFMMPHALWEKVNPLLPEEQPKPNGGHPGKPDREMMNGICYLIWDLLPDEDGMPVEGHPRMCECPEHHP